MAVKRSISPQLFRVQGKYDRACISTKLNNAVIEFTRRELISNSVSEIYRRGPPLGKTTRRLGKVVVTELQTFHSISQRDNLRIERKGTTACILFESSSNPLKVNKLCVPLIRKETFSGSYAEA